MSLTAHFFVVFFILRQPRLNAQCYWFLTYITKLLQSSQINKKFDNEVVEKNKD